MLLTLALIVGAAGYGAAVGSLLPRALYRLAVEPEEPWRRTCPQGHPLTGPARGWLGPARCPRCPRPRGYSYGSSAVRLPLTAAACCAGLAAATGPRPELAAWLVAVPVGLLLAAVDRRVSRLPDVLTLPLAGVTTLLLGGAALLPRADGSWTRALLAGAALGGCFGLLHLVSPRGMAFGDVKLAPAIGVALGWYGWDTVFAGVFLGFLTAAVYGAVLLLGRRAERGAELPFGPFLVLGGFLGVLAGALGG